MKTFKFYTDAGHGWLAVKITDMFKVGVAYKTTKYSYMRGLTAYLEEDCDMYQFLEAWKMNFGEYKIERIDHSAKNNGRSIIRSYDDWNLRKAEQINLRCKG